MHWIPHNCTKRLLWLVVCLGGGNKLLLTGALSSLRWKYWSVRTNDCELLGQGSAESILSKAKQERKRTILTCSYFNGAEGENILRESWQVNILTRDRACSVPRSLLIPESPATWLLFISTSLDQRTHNRVLRLKYRCFLHYRVSSGPLFSPRLFEDLVQRFLPLLPFEAYFAT